MNSYSVKLGRFFFQYRSYVPVVIYAAMLILPPNPLHTRQILWVSGALVAAAGACCRLWSIRHIGKRARTTKDKARYLISTGPFSLCRNPLYVANILTGSGFCIMFGLPWLLPAYVFLIGVFYHFIILYEENLLHGIFGSDYAQYCRKVPRWLPEMKIPERNPDLFPWSKVLRWERSYIGILVFGVIAALVRSFVL